MIIYLYVKQHRITKLKYFGKTIKNPFKYTGSGKYWQRHIKIYGNFIDTVEVYGFDSQDICTQFALNFSLDNNIVESQYWANLILEDGINAPPSSLGLKRKKSSVETSRIKRIGQKRSDEFCKHMSRLKTGIKTGPSSTEKKHKIRIKKLGKVWYCNPEKTEQLLCNDGNHPIGWIRGIKIRKNHSLPVISAGVPS
jgi:hypothetical protein